MGIKESRGREGDSPLEPCAWEMVPFRVRHLAHYPVLRAVPRDRNCIEKEDKEMNGPLNTKGLDIFL